MKNKFIIILLTFFCKSYSQETIKIKDLELPTSPAFTILDYTPTVISAPNSTKELTLSLINATSTSAGIPANFALEFSPYWLINNKNRDISSYYNLDSGKVIFEPFKNLSFSLASVKNENIQNISVGLRTNILKIDSKETIEYKKENKTKIKNLSTKIDNNFKNRTGDITFLNDTDYQADANNMYSSLSSLNLVKPVFSIDIATAYNHFFDKNEYKSGQTGRFGGWLTLNYNHKFTSSKNNYLSIYQYTRFLDNRMSLDSITNQYINRKDLDVGAKIELQLNNFFIGYEYIKRTNENENFRSVGNLKYKISENIVLNGGFGRNFEKNDNLVSFLGINWGLSSDEKVNVKSNENNDSIETKKTASVKTETKKSNDASAYESTNLNLNIIAVSSKTTNVDLILDDVKASFTIDFQKQGNDNSGSFNISQKENLDNPNQVIFAGKSGFIKKFQEEDEFDEKAFTENSKIFLQGNSSTDYITTVPNSLTFNDSNYIAFKVENKETKKTIYGWLKLSIAKDKLTIIKMGYLDRLPLSIGN